MTRLLLRILLIALFCLLYSGIISAQSVEVTFSVDMRYENVSPNGVHIAGTFQEEAGYDSNWDPSSTRLLDANGDNIYETTVSIRPGTYLYKFINGSAWQEKPELPSPVCSVHDGGGNYNRSVSILNRDTILPTLPFDSCQSVVQFSLKLPSDLEDVDIVSISGNFQSNNNLGSDWQANIIRMHDDNGDNIYEAEMAIKEGSYNYIYSIDNAPITYENLPTNCGTSLGGNQYRNLTVNAGITELPTDIFGSCEVYNRDITTDYNTYWWNDVVFYEIFVRSFYDSDGDGIGDINGIIEKLDYLNDGDPNTDDDLGVGGIWLMPIMPSPSYHGYDATDYYDIESDYGTMEDFERLIEEAHKRGIKVIIDFVMNHCSSQHPWFLESLNPGSPFRTWFIWKDINPGFNGPWGQQVWHNRNGKWYYGLFWGGMPDLNYDNPQLKNEMFDITEFWLNKGIDGFRLDAIKYLDENGDQLENTPRTFTLLEEFNDVYKSTNPDAFTVGEVWSGTASILPYVQNDRIDVCFDFDLAYGIINTVNNSDPQSIVNQIEVIQEGYNKLQYATFLTNHDIDRIFNQLGRNVKRMKQAASIYLTLPGVPFIYYGEEVGMTGTGAHENIRRPMQWSSDSYGGFSDTTPWIGLGDNSSTNNVANQKNDANSLFNHYRKLVHIRNNSTALKKGYITILNKTQSDRLSYARVHDEEAALITTNLGNTFITAEYNLNISGLQPGNYIVKDAFTNQVLGNIGVDGSGTITGLSSGRSLEPRQSEILIISKDNTVNSKEAERTNTLKVFPNPAFDYLIIGSNLDCAIESIQIFDINGSLISSNPNTTRLDISNLDSGIYLLRVKICDDVFVKKWIKH